MRSRSILAVVALGAALWAQPARAAEEYRTFTLNDGRVIVAEVLETKATGLQVKIPQGEIFIPFDQLAGMEEADVDHYRAQDDVYVYVAADATFRAGFVAAFDGLKHLKVLGPDDPGGVLTPDERQAAARCDVDLDCLTKALHDNPRWMWIVVGKMAGTDAVFDGALSTGPTRTHTSAPRVDLDAVNAAAEKAIQINPPPPAAVATGSPRAKHARAPLTRSRVDALRFVPLPGYPSLVVGDTGGFGLALGAVIPATALWIGATGKTTQSPVGQIALGLGGYYAATVVANEVLGMRTLKHQGGTAVGVVPTAKGGASVQVTFLR